MLADNQAEVMDILNSKHFQLYCIDEKNADLYLEALKGELADSLNKCALVSVICVVSALYCDWYDYVGNLLWYEESTVREVFNSERTRMLFVESWEENSSRSHI